MFVILFSILGGVLAAWVLSLFGADAAIINVFQPLLPQIELTTQHYYVAFGLLGLILGIIAFIKRR
ncbi:MAG: hypothetical protein LBE55_01225 [Clostridiales bacterium]|jgi:hypothetical protein|nr:hypothetical protein [Clostridiales bacterium]